MEDRRIMRKKKIFSKKFGVFAVLFLGLTAIGGAYASWYTVISSEARITSGVLDISFNQRVDEKYAAYITDDNGNGGVQIEAEFVPTEKNMEISFNEGIPIDALLEGKLLKLDFPLTNAEDNTINKLNYKTLDLTKPGETVELQVDEAMLVYEGLGYSLGENEVMFAVPLRFEIYKTLTEEYRDDNMGHIYLKLQSDCVDLIRGLPTSFSVNTEALVEKVLDLDFKDSSLARTVGNGIVVTYHCEIPFDVFQYGSKVQANGE